MKPFKCCVVFHFMTDLYIYFNFKINQNQVLMEFLKQYLDSDTLGIVCEFLEGDFSRIAKFFVGRTIKLFKNLHGPLLEF